MPVKELADHRKGPRRRGEALHHAVLEATLAELAEVGYAGLRMERVAERAQAGKASLYRRWPSRSELVVDALQYAAPEVMDIPDTGHVRTDLMTVLRRMADQLDGPSGEAVRGLLAEALSDPERTETARERLIELRGRLIEQIVHRAAERGEVRPDAVTPRTLEVGPVLVAHYFLIHGSPVPDRVLAEIVDEIVLPLIRI